MKKVTEHSELPEDFWEFVENHLPDYYRRDDVFHSDLLTRFIEDGEEDPDESDRAWLTENYGADFKAANDQLEMELYNEAVEAANGKEQEKPVVLYMAFGSEMTSAVDNLEEITEFTGGSLHKVTFNTEAEKAAYLQGVADADGWHEVHQLEDFQIEHYKEYFENKTRELNREL